MGKRVRGMASINRIFYNVNLITFGSFILKSFVLIEYFIM